jgi:hypothetical protein
MNYVDRYALKVDIDYDDIQLLGVTSFWIALKITESRRVKVQEICEYCAFTYTEKQILDMEKSICKVLNWEFMSQKTLYEHCIKASKQLSPDIYPLFMEPTFKSTLTFFNDVVLFNTCFTVWDVENLAFAIVLLTTKFYNVVMRNNSSRGIENLDFSQILNRAENIKLLDSLIEYELGICAKQYIINSHMIPILLKTLWTNSV